MKFENKTIEIELTPLIYDVFMDCCDELETTPDFLIRRFVEWLAGNVDAIKAAVANLETKQKGRER